MDSTFKPQRGKITVFASSLTGKTSFIDVLIGRGFIHDIHRPTIGLSHLNWDLVDNGCHFEVWELNSLKTSQKFWSLYFRQSTHIIIGASADTDNTNSITELERMEEWLKDINSINDQNSNKPYTICVLFRCDMIESNENYHHWLRDLANQYKLPYFECSAKTNDGIKEIQEAIINTMIVETKSSLFDPHQDVDIEIKSDINNNNNSSCVIQ